MKKLFQNEKLITGTMVIALLVCACISLYRKQYMMSYYFILFIVPIVTTYLNNKTHKIKIKQFINVSDKQQEEHNLMIKEYIGLFNEIKQVAEYLKSNLEIDDPNRENIEKVLNWSNSHILKFEIHEMTTIQEKEEKKG